MVITDIQKSVGTEIENTRVNSDPSQVNLQEELDAIDHVEKNLSENHSLSSRTLLESSNKTRKKRQSSKVSSSSKFRQLNIPYGTHSNNMLLGKRQLLINPMDQQMLALRQQQELAAATILTQQQMLNRLNNRYVDDYYDDDDSSYEDSDEFDDYRRYGMNNPLGGGMRPGSYFRPNHPMGIGRRSLPDDKPEQKNLARPSSGIFTQKNGRGQPAQAKRSDAFFRNEGIDSLLGPISKQGRWDTIEDYDLTSEFNRLQSRKGKPGKPGGFGVSSNHMDEATEEDDATVGVGEEDTVSRIGSLARHNLPKMDRQDASTDTPNTNTEPTEENTPSSKDGKYLLS
jgi:hypothetical protein